MCHFEILIKSIVPLPLSKPRAPKYVIPSHKIPYVRADSRMKLKSSL